MSPAGCKAAPQARCGLRGPLPLDSLWPPAVKAYSSVNIWQAIDFSLSLINALLACCQRFGNGRKSRWKLPAEPLQGIVADCSGEDDMMSGAFTFYEFFAGGGMAGFGLGADWRCLFANEIDPKKAAATASTTTAGRNCC